MADINKCVNMGCADRHKCFRYMAQPNQSRQLYSLFGPGNMHECMNFWSTETGYGELLTADAADESAERNGYSEGFAMTVEPTKKDA